MSFRVIRKTISEFLEDQCPRIAAALAYYTAFALSPTLIVIIGIGQAFVDPQDLRGHVRTEVESVVGEGGAEQIETLIDASDKQEKQGMLATAVSLGIMLIGATGLFAHLQSAMNDVWDVKPEHRRSGIIALLAK